MCEEYHPHLKKIADMKEKVRAISLKEKERDHELDEKMKKKVMKGY